MKSFRDICCLSQDCGKALSIAVDLIWWSVGGSKGRPLPPQAERRMGWPTTRNKMDLVKPSAIRFFGRFKPFVAHRT